MNKYLSAELQLAKRMLPDRDIQIVNGSVGYIDPYIPSKFWSMPRWCRDNAAAFALMVAYSCYPKGHERSDSIVVKDQLEYLADHPDKETAIRYAIVMAVIAKFDSMKTNQAPN